LFIPFIANNRSIPLLSSTRIQLSNVKQFDIVYITKLPALGSKENILKKAKVKDKMLYVKVLKILINCCPGCVHY
jgi:hypothetical protein